MSDNNQRRLFGEITRLQAELDDQKGYVRGIRTMLVAAGFETGLEHVMVMKLIEQRDRLQAQLADARELSEFRFQDIGKLTVNRQLLKRRTAKIAAVREAATTLLDYDDSLLRTAEVTASGIKWATLKQALRDALAAPVSPAVGDMERRLRIADRMFDKISEMHATSNHYDPLEICNAVICQTACAYRAATAPDTTGQGE